MASKSLGPFPKSVRWHEIIARGGASRSLCDVSLALLQERYDNFTADETAIDAMTFLVALVVSTRHPDPLSQMRKQFGFELIDNSRDSLLKFISEDTHPLWVAVCETVEHFLHRSDSEGSLFALDHWSLWREFDGSAFCELARHLYYRLNAICFAQVLRDLDIGYEEETLDHFAWEMSVITRAFSARWFNACARYQTPELGSIRWYLGHCMGKLDLELAREASDWTEPTGNPWKRRKVAVPSLGI